MRDAEVARAVLQRLDAIIANLNGINEQLGIMTAGPGALSAGAGGSDNAILELLVSNALPSSPAVTEQYVINAITPTRLVVNQSTTLMRVDITNDDPAQMMWVGDQNVSPQMGRVVLAQTTIPYVVPQGAEVHAICIVATLSARVSLGHNLWEVSKQLIDYYSAVV